MSEDRSRDKITTQALGPSHRPKREVTYAEFEKILDATPLFMRETPKKGDSEQNEVLEALRSLVFEGEGDGQLPDHPFLPLTLTKVLGEGRSRDELQAPRQRAPRPAFLPRRDRRIHLRALRQTLEQRLAAVAAQQSSSLSSRSEESRCSAEGYGRRHSLGVGGGDGAAG